MSESKPLGNRLAEAYDRRDIWEAATLCIEVMNLTDNYDSQPQEQKARIDAALGSLSFRDVNLAPNKVGSLIDEAAFQDAAAAFDNLHQMMKPAWEVDRTAARYVWIGHIAGRIEREYGLEPDRDGPDMG
jgi:hypothetical protein